MYGIDALSDPQLIGGSGFDMLGDAVEWAESRGRDNALGPVTRSGERAVGPMQLMRAATIDYLMANGLPADPETVAAMQRDPQKNREIGRWYLRQQYDRFGGDTDKALAAYNWGPARVQRLGDQFSIDRTPAETQKYIRAIQARMGEQPAGAPQGEAPMRDDSDPDAALESLMNFQPRQMASQGLAAFAGQQRPQAPQGQPMQGLDALNPAMQLAGQLMPQRRGMDWTDALMQGGAAMMASRRPDFLGALGEGVGRGHQTFMAGEDQRYKDQIDRMGLGLKLHTAMQKDTGEWAVSDGVQYNKKTGETRQVGVDKPSSDLGKLQADFQAGRIPQEVYEAELQKRRGETESPIMKVIREMGLPPDSPEAQSLIRKYADRVGTGAQVNIDQKAQSEEDKAMGKALGEQYIKYIDGGDAARQNNDRIDRLDQLLEGVSTGKFAGSLMELQRGLHAVLGKDAPVVWGRPAEVAQAEAAKAISNELALIARSPAGGAGMPGAMSDGDREFLKSIVPGIENTPEGRKLMISTTRKINQRHIEVAEMADAWREEKGTIRGFSSHLGKWAKANPLFPAKTETPQAAPAPAPGGPPLAPNAPTTPQDRQSIAPAIRRMSMDELRQLSPNGMSPEERAEAERRWDELKQQSIQSIPGGTP